MISDYLDSLVGALSFDRPLSGRVRQEVEDHLREAVAADPAGDGPEAERRAIANFGDPRVIAAEFAMVSLAKQTRRVGAAIILVIAGVRIFRLRAAGLWISGLLRIPRLLQSSGLWIPGYQGYSGQPAYPSAGYGSPNNSGYPAYSRPPASAPPSGSGQPPYPGGPGYGYQSPPPYSPYSGSGFGDPVAGYSGDRPSENWSPGAEYAIERAS